MRSPGRIALACLALALVACGGDGQSSDTMGPLAGDPGDTGGIVTTVDAPSSTAATVDPAQAGAGFVRFDVEVASQGIDETISLDRSLVPVADLDPLSLDGTCTALDGGEGFSVSVIDLRRLGSGARLVSATLRLAEAPVGAGEYEGALEVAGADQVTTSYESIVVVDEGGWTGSFEGTDENGDVATGSFVCAAEAVAVATTVPPDPGEEVPETT